MRKQFILSITLVGLIFVMALTLPLLSAATYQLNQAVDLKVPFEVNGSIASSVATCNISVQYPNSTYIARNESMTNLDNGEFNFTITSGELDELGEYSWIAFCCDGVYCAAGYDTFVVTPTGFTGTATFYFLILILSLGIIIFGFYAEDPIIILLGSFGLYFIGLYILFYGIAEMKDVVYTWAIGIIILMLAAYLSTRASYELITIKN